LARREFKSDSEIVFGTEDSELGVASLGVGMESEDTEVPVAEPVLVGVVRSAIVWFWKLGSVELKNYSSFSGPGKHKSSFSSKKYKSNGYASARIA
jgi:hypothetical protein